VKVLTKEEAQAAAAAEDTAGKYQTGSTGAAPSLTELPGTLEVRFLNEAEAKDAWQTQKKRLKKGKPPSDRQFAVTADGVGDLLSDVRVSSLETEGFVEVMQSMQTSNRYDASFQISRIPSRGGTNTVRVAG